MNAIIKKILSKEIMNYLFFGVLTTLVNLVSYKSFTLLNIDYRISTVLAWVLAVIFAYITNKLFVFESKSFHPSLIKKELSSFVLSRLFSGAFDLAFMIVAVEIFSIDDFLAKIFTNIFVVVMNYAASKLFVFNKTENNEIGNLNDEKKKDNRVYFLSFIIPILIMTILYIIKGIYPFGENCYLTSDMYHQYAPFYNELYNKLSSGGSLLYSWNIGMGVNFTALYAYYLSSPFNWLLIFTPKNHIIEAMSILIILKIALSSLAFSYYLSKHYQSKHTVIAAFATFYSLSAYLAAFSWNIMWLDCIVLFPLILLGLERLIKENNGFLYSITLGLSIYTNYYISIMICIFSVFYFIFLITTENSNKEKHYFKKRILSFGFYSLLSGGLAACLLIPEFYAIKVSASSSMNFPKTLTSYFSIFDIISRGLMIVEPTVISGRFPNIYSTIAVFLLLPFYWMNKSIYFKEKLGKTILVAILLISFNMNIPNFIWHGLHFPNSLPCRQSFIFVFLILTMSYDGFRGIKNYSDGQIGGTFAGAVAIFLVFEKLIVDETYHFAIIYVSILFVTIYFILIVLYRKYINKQKLITIILFIIIILEAGINTGITGIGTTSRTNYMADNKEISQLLNEVKRADLGFYRVEKKTRKTNNDSAWNQYKGVASFSSTAGEDLTKYFRPLGFDESVNKYSFDGYTPLTASLFSVKYMIYDKSVKNSEITSIYAGTESVFLYQNNYTLPLGFMLNGNFEEKWSTSNSNPFAVQNSFVNASTGLSAVFESVESTSKDSTVSIDVKDEKNIYIYITSPSTLDNLNISITDSSGYTQDPITFTNLKHKRIIDLGSSMPGSKISITTTTKDVTSLRLYSYSFNADIFKEFYDDLIEQPFNVEEFNDTYIKGTITSKIDGLMYTSIPYDEGWTAYIDGEKTIITPLKKALIAIPVSVGTHTIEFKYYPKGLSLGLIISFSSILVLLLLFIGIKYNNILIKKSNLNNNID